MTRLEPGGLSIGLLLAHTLEECGYSIRLFCVRSGRIKDLLA